MSGQPFENGRVVLPSSWARPEDPMDDRTPMQDITWREIGHESGRLFAVMMLGVTLLALVYILGWR